MIEMMMVSCCCAMLLCSVHNFLMGSLSLFQHPLPLFSRHICVAPTPIAFDNKTVCFSLMSPFLAPWTVKFVK